MPLPSPSIIPAVVSQHVEEAASLRNLRSVLVRAPHVKLLQLGRLDERIAAHLDGVSVAGQAGAEMVQATLEQPGVGQLFVAAAGAIERRDSAQLSQLLALVGVVDDAECALASAVGFVAEDGLRGLTPQWLGSKTAVEQWLGVTACALHGVDPGQALQQAASLSDTRVRVRALRTAGDLGRIDMLQTCLRHLSDSDATVRHAAARSALLLGDRVAAPRALEDMAFASAVPAALSRAALQLLVLATDPPSARALVREMLNGPLDRRQPLRVAIEATGWSGEVCAVPWLIEQMEGPVHARVAGEAFSLITGADLTLLDLDRKPPDEPVAGPSENPEDDEVALDADESLPWPDPARVRAWWALQTPPADAGRLLLGAPATAETCERALREAAQRQRAAAAILRLLLEPGRVLFNIAAPAWRQQHALGLPVRVS